MFAVIRHYHFDKKAMLRSYLDYAFFGSRLIGAERASLALFGTWPSNLSRPQAAQLAALLVYPRPLSPTQPWLEKVNRRAEYGLKVLARLEMEFHDSGKSALFDRLKGSLLAEENGLSYAELGAQLGLKEDAVKQAVHRMRRRYRELFREEIAQTVAGPDEVEDELKHLFAVLSA
jgi:membrane peptidoglycan carboxypeptidase